MCRSYQHLWLENLSANEIVNTKTFSDYEIQRIDFLKLLLFIIHVTSGQPGRGTEVVDIRYANTATLRNLFYDIETKMLYIWSRYHKGYNQSASEKHICRFLPKVVSQLTLRYLWLVLPFTQSIEALRRGTKIKSNYLFSCKTTVTSFHEPDEGVFKSIDLTHTLCQTFMRYVDSRVTINVWRHVAIAIVDKHFKSSTARQNFVDLDDEWDLQCAHSPAVTNNTYANLKSLPDIATSKFHTFRHISQLWHDLLGVSENNESENNESRKDSISYDTFRYVANYNRGLRLDKLSTSFDARACLKRYFDDDKSAFRGKQEYVLHAIQKQIPNILHIEGTGGGKSLSFLLLGYNADGGTTIVIAPLVSLKYDFLDRCRRYRINAVEWSPMAEIDQFCTGVSLIFVTPESSVSPKFKAMIFQLKQLQLLDRIVFDECHMYLDCTDDFREKMGNIGRYYNEHFGTQRIYLTATLPPTREIDLCHRMQIDPYSIQKFRSRTRRHNISYNVSKLFTNQGCFDTIKQEIQKLQQRDEKVILFCRTVDDVELLSNELGCYKYYRAFEQKEESFRNWKDQTGVQVVAATSGLGAGIDIPNITLAILFGAPKNLSDLVQATGRTGRNGTPSQALILDIDRNKYFKPDQYVVEFLESNKCRRLILDQYMDGQFDVSHICNYENDGESCCDVCRLNQVRISLPLISQRGLTPTPTPLTTFTTNNISDVLDCDSNDLFDYHIYDLESPIHDLDSPTQVAIPNVDVPDLPVPDLPAIVARKPPPDTMVPDPPTFDAPYSAVPDHLTIEAQKFPPDSFVPDIANNEERLLPTFDDAAALSDLRNCKSYLDRFRNRCTLCVLVKNSTPSQSLFQCKLHNSSTKKEILDRMTAYRSMICKRKLIPDFHGCAHSGCYIPQCWCPRWEMFTTQGDEIRYRKTSSGCIYRNVVLEVIVGCTVLSKRCKSLHDTLKGDQVEHQTRKIIWGNVQTICLMRTFFSIYGMYCSTTGKRKRT